MKNSIRKKIVGLAAVGIMGIALLSGCGQEEVSENGGEENLPTVETGEQDTGTETALETEQVSELTVTFGDDGEPFTMYLEENETAAAIARYVGTSDWRLPIYENDDDADYSVMQYYDIPSRYEIPADTPQSVTQAKAGEVYYSEPNRIVLFYQDAEISEEYTYIGHFEATEEFVTAVKENPVLEGWGNKIVKISQ